MVVDGKQRQRNTLLNWYEANRRVLPWREDPSAYHVWISEIMLQQTRVEAVLGYYERFLQALPDIPTLAAAPEDQCLKLWQGLGYYSRVRNLRKAAEIVVSEYGGVLPPEPEKLRKLPGIGRYTAAAIASISFGKRIPAVDGNLLRIWARQTAYAGNISANSAVREAEQFYLPILPEENPGDANQALMDLGAMVCLPQRPRCTQCPWEADCAACAKGVPEDYPVKNSAARRKIQKRTVFLILFNGAVALQKRPDKGLLAGLYELPSAEGHLTRQQALSWLRRRNVEALRIERMPESKHVFSHLEWHMIGYRVLAGAWPDPPDRYIFATLRQREEEYALPSAFAVYLNQADY